MTILELAGGFVSVDVPDGWEQASDPYPGIELVVVEPEQDGLFRANLVVTVTDVAMSFGDWQKGTDVFLAGELHDYLLLDLERMPVGGHPGARRLATHATAENQSVTVQQWMTLINGRGVTLSASCGTLAFATAGVELERSAHSLRINPTHTAAGSALGTPSRATAPAPYAPATDTPPDGSPQTSTTGGAS